MGSQRAHTLGVAEQKARGGEQRTPPSAALAMVAEHTNGGYASHHETEDARSIRQDFNLTAPQRAAERQAAKTGEAIQDGSFSKLVQEIKQPEEPTIVEYPTPGASFHPRISHLHPFVLSRPPTNVPWAMFRIRMSSMCANLLYGRPLVCAHARTRVFHLVASRSGLHIHRRLDLRGEQQLA